MSECVRLPGHGGRGGNGVGDIADDLPMRGTPTEEQGPAPLRNRRGGNAGDGAFFLVFNGPAPAR